jgi:hypothetical protein
VTEGPSERADVRHVAVGIARYGLAICATRLEQLRISESARTIIVLASRRLRKIDPKSWCEAQAKKDIDITVAVKLECLRDAATIGGHKIYR